VTSRPQPAADKRVFTYAEALASFPRVRQLTVGAVRQVDALYQRIQSFEEREARQAELEAATAEIVRQWSERVMALGCEVKGVWLVDWDNGDGYYCWRYPEESLAHYHGYDEGFAGRVAIQ
jgi:hypothetical protein